MSFYQKHVQKDGSWLSLMEKPAETSYECGGCKESDVQPCYKGNVNGNPQYHLHKECYDSYSASNSSLKFPFLKNKGCDFKFQQQVPHGGSCCDACGKRVNGWSFKCEICSHPHYLHSSCAKLPIEQEVEGIVLNLAWKSPRPCLICGKKDLNISTWYYVSRHHTQYCSHWSCMKDMKDMSVKSLRVKLNRQYNESGINLKSLARSTGGCLLDVAAGILSGFFSLVFTIPVPVDLIIPALAKSIKWVTN